MGGEGVRLMAAAGVSHLMTCIQQGQGGGGLRGQLWWCSTMGGPPNADTFETCGEAITAACALGDSGRGMLKELEIPAACEEQ